MPDDASLPLRALDQRDTAFALHRALAARRHGHDKRVLDSTLHSVAAELLAEALAEAGYVLAEPIHPDRPTGGGCSPAIPT